MARIALKAEYVRDLPLTETGQKFVFDTALPGFGIRIGTKAKAYICESRVKGRSRRVTIGRTDQLTLNDARRLAKRELAAMAGGVDRNKEKAEERASTMTLAEALNLYLKDNDLKESTATENRRLITGDFSDWLDKDVKGLTPTMVVRRFDKITERSPSVANHACWVLRAVMNYARVVTKTDAGEFTLPPNPCERLTDLNRWHKAKARTGKLAKDQFPAFFDALDAANNCDFADFMELLVRAGLRRNEAASLLWSDVDFESETFTIRAEVSKNGKALTLPTSKQIMALFERRREAAPDSLQIFGDAKRFDPRKSLNKLREAVGSDLTYHDLRRTFLSVAEEQAVPYSLLKKLGNHSAGNDVTLKHYANTIEHETLRPYMQKVNDQIDRLAKIDNPELKARDAVKRLNSALQDLEEFEQYQVKVGELKRMVAELT